MTRSILLAALAAFVLAAGAQAKDKPIKDGGTIPTPTLPATIRPIEPAPLTPEPGVADGIDAPSMLPGDGGGSVGPGCAVAGARSGYDGVSYDDTVTAYYHWCYHNGNVWDAYGWSVQDVCQLLCDRDGKDEYGFSYGHWVRGYWTVFSISKYIGLSWHASATACVAVDGWFNVWGC